MKTILKDFWNHWKSDFKNNKMLFWFEFTGTIVSMLASILIALYANNPPMLLIFNLWLYGSIAMSISFFIRRDGSALVLMLWYTGINVIGLTNLLF